MGLGELLLLAVGLSMDAFAVAICKGLAMRKIRWRDMLIVGAWFGVFQGIMPFTGYVLGIQFERFINAIAPWCAFVLLGLIGGNMIHESLGPDDEEETATLHFKEMLMLAVATSIDALAVGITFACVPIRLGLGSALANTGLSCLIIACTTCLISMAGVKVGNVFGVHYKKKAESVGGVILILLGAKILLEGLGVL